MNIKIIILSCLLLSTQYIVGSIASTPPQATSNIAYQSFALQSRQASETLNQRFCGTPVSNPSWARQLEVLFNLDPVDTHTQGMYYIKATLAFCKGTHEFVHSITNQHLDDLSVHDKR